MRRGLIIAIIAVLCAAGGAAWWWTHRERAPQELKLYGNIDLRQVSVAFNNSERIATVLVQEGDRVHKGEVLARLDTSRLTPQVAVAAANVEVDKVNVQNARQQYRRAQRLWTSSHGGAISKQDLDNAKAALDAAAAHRDADEAQLSLLRQQLADAVLYAPVDGTIRSRLLEPGDMASPQKPVFTLAMTTPKWVRAYVAEPDLGRIRPGMKAQVMVDSFPNHPFAGWIGFISPVAEFTPKPIETVQLRTDLVYEVRVFVKDPNNVLRLGMPATVVLPFKRISATKGTAARKPEAER